MGRSKGIKKNSDSTSNLIWEIERILLEAKENNQELPKYLLLENVNQLLSKKHKNDYKQWNKLLKKEFNYETFVYQLDSYEFGMLQKRKRIFAISIRNSINNWTEEEILKIINEHKSNWTKQNINKQILRTIDFETNDQLIIEEQKLSIPRKTSSRIKIANKNKNLKRDNITFLNTLTTKQDRHPNIGMIDLPNNLLFKGYLEKRFITPREAYRIMGFTNEDFNKIRPLWIEKKYLTKESLYRQAGNSIAIKVLEAVFKTIDKIETIENQGKIIKEQDY